VPRANPRSNGVGRTTGVLVAIAIVVLSSARAWAFGLDGHEIIEAAAYKRLLALDVVPSTGAPGVSGRALLGTLIATGVLDEPPCFNRDRPLGDCDPSLRLDFPLRYWPSLHAGAPDLVLDRQLGQQGQCQHFMANTGDALTPVDGNRSLPVPTKMYSCVPTATAAIDEKTGCAAPAEYSFVGLPVNASKAAKFTAFLDWALPAAVPGGRIWVKVPPA